MQAGKLIKVGNLTPVNDSDFATKKYVDDHSGGTGSLEVATNTELGGVKANSRTGTESADVRIDPTSGFLAADVPIMTEEEIDLIIV